jgi:hypothetical protein
MLQFTVSVAQNSVPGAMPLQLDHAIIAVQDLNAAMHDYRSLGFTAMPGGVHANRATHNALITFANGTYLELLAATHEPPLPDVIDFSTLLQHGEGPVGFALRSNDLEADTIRLRAEGFAVGEIIPGERRRTDGALVQWKLALLGNGFAPFFIQDVSPQAWRIPTDPAITTHANTAMGLRCVEIAGRDLQGAQDRYTRLFGLSPTHLKDGEQRTVGDIVLREVVDAAQPETMSALHLAFSDSEKHGFSLERTHQVRFRVVPPASS